MYFYFTVKKSEVECLIRLFHSLVERANVRLNNFGLDRNAFRAILHSVFGMTDDMLMNRGKSLKKLKWTKLRWQYIYGVHINMWQISICNDKIIYGKFLYMYVCSIVIKDFEFF